MAQLGAINYMRNNMQKITYLISKLGILFIIFLAANAQSKTPEDLPPILDYYPNCDYQDIGKFVAREKAERPRARKVTDKLLKRLREEALDVGANAVILEDISIVKDKRNRNARGNMDKDYGLEGGTLKLYDVRFQALLIKTCQNSSGIKGKLAPYNHLGDIARASNKLVLRISTQITLTPPKKAKLHRPAILQKEVSLTNGVYGINLGSNYAEVLASFGDPSFELNLFKDELIISYGRHHWLHFQEDKLVKVSSEFSLISQDILNKIPLIDFFDDSVWEINNLVTRKASLAEIKKALKVTGELNNKNQLTINNASNTMILSFSYSNDSFEKDENYTLSGFSLYKNTYQEPVNKTTLSANRPYNSLTSMLSALEKNEDIQWSQLNEKLGEPIGRITVSATSYINIYNDNLAILIKGTELNSIYLVEQIFNAKLDEKPWSLGPFAQGKTIAQLQTHFPEDAFTYESEVQISNEAYQLSLFFNEYDEQGLYEVMLKLE